MGTGEQVHGDRSIAADPWRGEQLVFCHDAASGLRAVIAIDDMSRGPAFGGVRYKAYPSTAAGANEAQRLAAAMTLKHAAAGLPYGGGKSVIFDDGPPADRDALMRAFGRFVARLGGSYMPGVDMGTTTADLARMGDAGATVSCSEEDPSPWTASGVWAALRAAVGHVDGPGGRVGLQGARILIQGTGHVGAALARHVARDGAEVLIADIDVARAAALAAEVGGQVVDPERVAETPCDVYAPCAIAGVVGPESVERLQCRIIAGAANDTLTDDAIADRLAARGIVYVPDFVANAGGVIHVHALRRQWDAARLQTEVLRIGDRVSQLLADAASDGETPLSAARRLAARRIAEAHEAVAIRERVVA
jgi:leucine dehydrogenase